MCRGIQFEKVFASRKSREPILVVEDKELEALKVEPSSLVTSRTIE